MCSSVPVSRSREASSRAGWLAGRRGTASDSDSGHYCFVVDVATCPVIQGGQYRLQLRYRGPGPHAGKRWMGWSVVVGCDSGAMRLAISDLPIII